MKQFLRTLILLLVRLLGAPGARAAAQQARKPLPTVPRILLIRPDHLGDLVLATPVLHALRTHALNAHITMMVGPWSSEIVARHPDIDQLLTFPFPGFQRARQKPWTPYILLLSAAQQLRRSNYDLVINLRPDFWWGAALTYLARIPRRIGYAIKPGTPFLTRALPFTSPEHWTISNLRLASAALETLGYPALAEPYTPERYPLQFTPTPEEHKWIAERLSKEGIDAQTPIVVIHPGTAAAVKLWRPEAWSHCANALTSSLTQPTPVSIILTGSKHEQLLMEEIARGITSPTLLITDATLGQLTALLARAQLVLGVDSGPPHLATSQSTPTVRIFGPTDPRLAGPWGPPEQHLVVASTQRCPGCPIIPCGRIDFRPEELPAHPCTRLVPEQQVMEAIEKASHRREPTNTTMNDKKTTEQPQNNLDDNGYPFPPSTYQKLRKTAIRTSKSILGTCIYLLMSIIGGLLWLARLGKHYPPLTPQTFHPQRILVIRLDLIGDLVLSLTVVRALKRTYPDTEIDLLATPASAKIALHDPYLAEIITYDPNIWRRPKALLQPKNWRDMQSLLQRLHARHYDLAISVYGQWAGVLAVLSGAKRRVGFGRESYPGFMTDSVPGRHWSPLDNKHEVDYCLELAQAAGATRTADDRIPHLVVDAQSAQEIEQLLRKEGLQEDKPLIACHVGSNNGQSKRWPLPYWATLLDRLIRQEGAQIVLTGAPSDLPIIENIIGHMRERPINLAGKTSLTQLAALLQRANLVISGDSGPIHMATALGVPIIGIYGPTNPSLSGPVSPAATVLRSDIWCSPCYNTRDPADCRFYTTQCMKNITPTQVFEVVQNKLK